MRNVYDMWGKKDPYKSLIHHMIDTGFMCKALLSRGVCAGYSPAT